MRLGTKTVEFALGRPKLIAWTMALLCAVLIALAALPSLWPATFPMLNGVKVDTDPENMLRADEEVRVFHNAMKAKLNLNDIMVVGVVNEEHAQGVFNPATLKHVYELTEYAKTLETEGHDGEGAVSMIIQRDIIAPSTVDNIGQGGLGVVRFEWLMAQVPTTDEAAAAIRDKAANLPFLNGTLVSEDGRALAVYLPLRDKHLSYEVYSALNKRIEEFGGTQEEYYITGLPVAEDVFGVEMFVQMAVSAPLAMVVIFILLLIFFRKLVLIVSPMVVAMVSVIFTMGLLVLTGNTVHIMSSMIPIFIMPIAVLDSVHILSEFFDRYQKTRDRRKTMVQVMETLFVPMLYTSLTSAAGFASLALTPIPPVQVFGIFVGLGVLFAWIVTILFIPAYAMLIPERALANFGATHSEDGEMARQHGLIAHVLNGLGRFSHHHFKLVLAASAIIVVVSAYGISHIQVNDNPIKWFKASHPIREADRVLNAHFGGTYMAYLALHHDAETPAQDYLPDFDAALDAYVAENKDFTEGIEKAGAALKQKARETVAEAEARPALLALLLDYVEGRNDAAESGDYAWEELITLVEQEQQKDEVFKQPEALRYIASLQAKLEDIDTADGRPLVGKSNSLADIVKTVHRELFEGKEEAFRIPDRANAVAQTLITYEGSHRPHDLWHFTTPDYKTTSLWVQLKSGDNKDMARVVAEVQAFIAENPPPIPLEADWFGLTYINVVWQEKMVNGMLQAFMGSFLVVMLMMTILFRSALWGLLSMIPLTLTIALIYGVIGIIGKDYDMPVAVLSSLTLGLAVDFAIHFLARARSLHDEHGSWTAAQPHLFGEPARAIARNVLVIAIGFTPLLLAPLLPYVTVGFFLASILFVSGAATLLLLPALMRPLEPMLFPATRFLGVLCNSATCVFAGLACVALLVVNIHQFFAVGLTTLTWFSFVALPVLSGFCAYSSRHRHCGPATTSAPDED